MAQRIDVRLNRGGVTQVGKKPWWSDMAAYWLSACGAIQNKPYLDNQSVGFVPSTKSIVHASCAVKRWTELLATRNTNSCTTYTKRARSTRKCLSVLLRRSPTLKVLLYQRTQHCASTCHTAAEQDRRADTKRWRGPE